MRQKRERGHGKHRTVGVGDEEPWFKTRRAKSRVRGKQQRKSRKANRRK
jgi:hypothetical protein